ncbi:bZIP transcription factor family protein [Euphorbia peplus]|nr:bZIP transcription factor family protein [Euphorbia peplus]
MNSIFSVDDISDLLWQGPIPSPAMSRCPSEWELEKFLEDFPAPTPAPATSSASDSSVSRPTLAASQSSKPRNVDDDVVEIRKPEIALHRPLLDRPLDLDSTDSDEYRAFLKSQLHLACAAAAKARVKPEVTASLPEDQRIPIKISQLQSQDSGNGPRGSEVPKSQGEVDGGSVNIPALSPIQRVQDTSVRQTTSGSSREDSDDDDLDGDTETNEQLGPSDVKRARRMQSNRESARRSRRRKQAQLSELEAQVGQLRDERTTLLTRLTDVNKKCDDASVDHRILNANIETLRTKVKMAEDQVKRVTGLNPMLLARTNTPSMGMQFVAGQTDASTNVARPMQPNNNHFFHHSGPNINSGAPLHIQRLNSSCLDNNFTANPPADNIGVAASVQHLTGVQQSIANIPAIQHVQKQTGPTVNPARDNNKGVSQPVTKDNKK